MSLIAPFCKTIFNGVKPSWRRILLGKELKPKLDKCFVELDNDLKSKGVTRELIGSIGLHNFIRPSIDHILEAFKYFDAKNLRFILCGQDPFPSPVDAHGLSFSSGRGTKPPASQRKIRECLIHHGLMEPNDEVNLTNWARQGGLLLNAYLTRTPNIMRTDAGVTVQGNGGSDKNCLHTFWESFTGELLDI